MVRTREHANSQLRTAATFAERLDTLKRSGCNLLVVGAGHQSPRTDVCRRLLASGGNEPRRRILVTTDTSGRSVEAYLPAVEANPGGTPAKLIDVQTPTRTSIAATPNVPTGVEYSTVQSGDLSSLGIEIHEAIEAFDAQGTLNPAELRLCFDSLTPIVEAESIQTIFRFLHLVTGCVNRVNGMGHYHLPVARHAEIVRILEPLFDGIVELRTNQGESEQRWHLVEEDVVTSWIPL